MQDIVLSDGYEGGVVDAVVVIEMFVFRRDERLPEHGIHFLVGHRCAVLTEELAYLLAVGAVDDGSLRWALVLDGGHRGRLAEEPQEVDIYGSEVEEEGHDDRYDK